MRMKSFSVENFINLLTCQELSERKSEAITCSVESKALGSSIKIGLIPSANRKENPCRTVESVLITHMRNTAA